MHWCRVWAEAGATFRSDVGLVIELAEEVHRVVEFERDSAAHSKRVRKASALGVAARAARKAEHDAAALE
ncbi:hypothetical protein [Microbacterium sp. GXS0129]|uniref:hypothetical protein n=1 Tax=Microbacterium sp. GXS0129 TaxID=3377836 RepID=UPI00383A0450